MSLGEGLVPSEMGFRMPAEWELHEATWIAWPHNAQDWPGKFAAIPWVYADIVHHLHRSECVHIVVSDARHEQRVRRVLHRAGVDLEYVRFFRFETNRSWVRDSGPIFIAREIDDARRDVAITNWHFNAWAKYSNWAEDDLLPQRIAGALGMQQCQPVGGRNSQRVVLEGGSIDVNGAGILLTTEECLLCEDQQQRNPGLTREDLEEVLRRYLGIQKVIWLNRGIAGDDTHGHVDDIARFVDERTVVVAWEDDPREENYACLADNYERLSGAVDLVGNPVRIVKLPMPRPIVFAGQRLPASYANFYIANRIVLVPTFNDPNDRVALNVLQELFPMRKVVGIHSLDLVWGLGTLHCMTQQQPARFISTAQ